MATNERIRRQTGPALSVAAAVAMLVAPVLPTMRTAEAGDWMPMLPDQDFYDFQLFAPPDLNEYGIWERKDEGLYFSYDRLYWGITIPRTTRTAETATGELLIPSNPISPSTIADLNNQYLAYASEFPISVYSQPPGGDPTLIPQTAPQASIISVGADPLRMDLNTSWLRTKMTSGNRLEGGWSYDGRGLHFSYLGLDKQYQEFVSVNEFAVNSPTQDVTVDVGGVGGGGGGGGLGGGGAAIANIVIEQEVDSPPPDHLITQVLTQRNETQIQGGSAALTLKRELSRYRGATRATFSLGPRFIQFADKYSLDYASFQNAFNAPFGGEGGGGGGGGGAGGGANNNQNQNNQNQNQNNQNQNITGPAGNVLMSDLSGAGQLGISLGDVPSTLTGEGPGSLFQVAAWETYTSNNLVGPEFGLLLEGSTGRWNWYAGGNFTAGFNWQNNIYRGANLPTNTGADYLRTNFAGGGANAVVVAAPVGGLAAGAPAVNVVEIPSSPLVTQLFPTGQYNTTNAAEHRFVFSPIGEWRLGGSFQVSQSISLKFGYTGMWLSQIARAASNTDYVTKFKPVQQVARNNTGQDVFVNANNIQVPAGTPGARAIPSGSPENYVRTVLGSYTQIAPQNGGNEYVFTNGIDFGLEVKF